MSDYTIEKKLPKPPHVHYISRIEWKAAKKYPLKWMNPMPNLMFEDWTRGRRKQRQDIRISVGTQKERKVIRFPLFQLEDCIVSSITVGI